MIQFDPTNKPDLSKKSKRDKRALEMDPLIQRQLKIQEEKESEGPRLDWFEATDLWSSSPEDGSKVNAPSDWHGAAQMALDRDDGALRLLGPESRALAERLEQKLGGLIPKAVARELVSMSKAERKEMLVMRRLQALAGTSLPVGASQTWSPSGRWAREDLAPWVERTFSRPLRAIEVDLLQLATGLHGKLCLHRARARVMAAR